MPPPWWVFLWDWFYAIRRWTPVPIRLGKLCDLKAYRDDIETALDMLEAGGDQGANMARAYLYSVLEEQ